LLIENEIIPINVAEIPGQTFFIRSDDFPTLKLSQNSEPYESGVAFIAPLDNLIWNRALIQQIFDFEYIWEVYKPKAQRKFGYYVLPVIYGDRFIARIDPTFDKKNKVLVIQNWWWEDNIIPDDEMISLLKDCIVDFINYLGAEEFRLGDIIKNKKSLRWMKEVNW